MRPPISQQTIEQVAQTIAQQFEPEQIILFGSWAYGNPTASSDVDFLIVKKTDDPRMLARRIDRSLFPRPFPLDLLVYHPERLERRKQSGDSFVNEVLKKGKILYARTE